MFTDFLKPIGLDIPAAVIEALGTAVETIGELADSETIQSVGQFIRDNAEDIAS